MIGSDGQSMSRLVQCECVRLPVLKGSSSLRPCSAGSAVFEVQNVMSPTACDRARLAVNEAFDAGKTTDRGVSLPTQDVMVSALPQRSQDEIKTALELAANRVSLELPGVTLEFVMSRAFVIVYDAAHQKGLKKHTDGRKEGATLLLLISKPQRDFDGGGTRFHPGVLESSFDAKPGLGSTIVFPSDTLQHEGLPIKRGRRHLVCVFATKKKTTDAAAPGALTPPVCPPPASSRPRPTLKATAEAGTPFPQFSENIQQLTVDDIRKKQSEEHALTHECGCVVS